jgi:hypothetical protein
LIIADLLLFGYANIESLVLWARSEKIGCAVIECHGKMEHWNVGIMGMEEEDLFYRICRGPKIKSENRPLLRPNNPFFHHSIIPWVIDRHG